MEEKFEKFRTQLRSDEAKNAQKDHLFKLKEDYESGKIDFYDLIDQMHEFNTYLYKLANYLENTELVKIEIIDKNVIFTTRKDSIKLVFNGEDRRGVPFEMINWGSYETEERSLFESILVDGMTIFDVGANLGWYSLLFGKNYPKSKIYSFEPIFDTYKYLLTNVVLNGLRNVYIYNFGFSDAEMDTIFYYYSEASCLASMKNVLNYDNAKQITCKLKMLDSFIQESKIENIDVIKCDVEGAEFQVMLGGNETINKFLPIASLELFDEWSKSYEYHPQEVIDWMKRKGYSSFLPLQGKLELVEEYQKNSFDRQNYFFLHKEKHREIIDKLKI